MRKSRRAEKGEFIQPEFTPPAIGEVGGNMKFWIVLIMAIWMFKLACAFCIVAHDEEERLRALLGDKR